MANDIIYIDELRIAQPEDIGNKVSKYGCAIRKE